MAKLIFCFDGTSNDPSDSADFFEDSSISNILKLHALFGGTLSTKCSNKINQQEQKSFYYSGVGTRGNWLRQKLNAMFSPPHGEMNEIIKQAKEDLKQFKLGDEIYIFGFSRGAAIARMFAAKHLDGKKVKFLGVFDTVAAIRGSLDLDRSTYPASGILFENGTLGKQVEKALHLLSIDEKRLAFQPTLFNKDERVTEIWFSGVHSDIGGGYWFDALSDITLDFMCKEAKKQGLSLLKADEIEYDIFNEEDIEDENKICIDDIEITPLLKGKLHEQLRSTIVNKTLAPRFVRVNVDDKYSKDHLPIIHHSVYERFLDVTSYRPYSLRNCRYKIIFNNGKIGEESYLGINGLRNIKVE
ncbi:MAG: phospholipase effector Tle1 domain-containing protein [Halarcobacter sp.]